MSSNEETYTKEWLHRKQIEMQMSMAAMPEHMLGDEDPAEIRHLKGMFIRIRADMTSAMALAYNLQQKATS